MDAPSLCFIDHHDSFSWNLIAQIRANGVQPLIIQGDAPVGETVRAAEAADFLVLSPGPGSPSDYPGTMAALEAAVRANRPVLGVCLGFQAILASFGSRIIRQPRVLHGVQTELRVVRSGMAFEGLDDSIPVARYHSLCVESDTVPDEFQITGVDAESGVVLAVEHVELPIIGLQFHPDSFLTPQGDRILANCIHSLLRRTPALVDR